MRLVMSDELVCLSRRIFLTVNGHIGLGPPAIQSGDKLAILGGADMPCILRKAGSSYEFVGECYVDDIMRGDAKRIQDLL